MAQKQELRGTGYLWLLVTFDDYEFPLFIADSLTELSWHTGRSEQAIRSAVSHAERGGRKSQYRRVPKEDLIG